MTQATDRLGLPLLAVAQAQKEMSHNEALALIDIASLPVVEAVGQTTVPMSPLPGQCWIVGVTATGAWVGKADHIAGWTTGGWRFVAPREGMALWSIADRGWVRRVEAGWMVGAQGAAIANPSGGTVIDVEARAAIGALLGVARAQGLIAL